MTSNSGSADVLDALGVRMKGTDPPASGAAHGFAFMLAPTSTRRCATPARPGAENGVRTAFNLIGPLTNPARVTRRRRRDRRLGRSPRSAEPSSSPRRPAGIRGPWGRGRRAAPRRDRRPPRGRPRTASARAGQIPGHAGWPRRPRRARRRHAGRTPRRRRAILSGDPGARRDVVLLNAAADRRGPDGDPGRRIRAGPRDIAVRRARRRAGVAGRNGPPTTVRSPRWARRGTRMTVVDRPRNAPRPAKASVVDEIAGRRANRHRRRTRRRHVVRDLARAPGGRRTRAARHPQGDWPTPDCISCTEYEAGSTVGRCHRGGRGQHCRGPCPCVPGGRCGRGIVRVRGSAPVRRFAGRPSGGPDTTMSVPALRRRVRRGRAPVARPLRAAGADVVLLCVVLHPRPALARLVGLARDLGFGAVRRSARRARGRAGPRQWRR